MPTRRLRIQRPQGTAIADGIAAIRREMQLPLAFPPEVEAAAARAAGAPRLPGLDRTDIPFVTIDPKGAMDLDQALYVQRQGDGYRVFYAIADVGAFVSPGDAVDVEAHARGETLYGGDGKIPLHPKVLSEGAASLLPDQVRSALVWTIDLDATGEGIAVDVRRARVRSRARLDYDGVQAEVDAGSADPLWALVRTVGELRRQREQRRGGISLPLPEQEVEIGADGQWKLAFRARHPVEDWNEQLSLLTGMAAAHLMVEAKVGLLRTLPKPEPWAIARLRRTAAALDIPWPEAQDYPDFIRSLDPSRPRDVAMMTACTTVLRGAGYVAFDGSVPAQPAHWALAAEYAHATAPLRRLADRYVGELCVALCAKAAPPDWVLAALPALPATMQAADTRAGRYERAVLDLVEAVTLAPRVGEAFDGTVVELARNDPRSGIVMLRDPAIESQLQGAEPLPLGARVQARLVQADPATRATRFAWSPPAGSAPSG
ncbi:MAG TPA: RNB domain-containing ribonuclease [Xanthomonadaceae bacterium]|nr:RNB domain-containing ribonuclease [Xanthomonadaceae bacterium]